MRVGKCKIAKGSHQQTRFFQGQMKPSPHFMQSSCNALSSSFFPACQTLTIVPCVLTFILHTHAWDIWHSFMHWHLHQSCTPVSYVPLTPWTLLSSCFDAPSNMDLCQEFKHAHQSARRPSKDAILEECVLWIHRTISVCSQSFQSCNLKRMCATNSFIHFSLLVDLQSFFYDAFVSLPLNDFRPCFFQRMELEDIDVGQRWQVVVDPVCEASARSWCTGQGFPLYIYAWTDSHMNTCVIKTRPHIRACVIKTGPHIRACITKTRPYLLHALSRQCHTCIHVLSGKGRTFVHALSRQY